MSNGMGRREAMEAALPGPVRISYGNQSVVEHSGARIREGGVFIPGVVSSDLENRHVHLKFSVPGVSGTSVAAEALGRARSIDQDGKAGVSIAFVDLDGRDLTAIRLYLEMAGRGYRRAA